MEPQETIYCYDNKERKHDKKGNCLITIAVILLTSLAVVLGLIIGAAISTAILGALAAVIVLAVILALLLLLSVILIFCNRKKQRKDKCCC